MSWLNKLPNSIRSASGMEWTLWRKLPLIFVVGTAMPLALAVVLHLGFEPKIAADARWLQTMDYVGAGVVIFHSCAKFTLAL